MKQNTKSFNLIIILPLLVLSLAGCANFGQKLKAFLGGKSSPPPRTVQSSVNSAKKYSQTPAYMMGTKRQYKRMTKQKLENESQLSDDSGSLWVMEGQGAYLFSQNIMRMVGDPIAIRIEGEPKEQLVSKTKIISGLLEKLEQRRLAAKRKLASVQSAEKKGDKTTKTPKAKTTPGNKPVSDSDFNVKTVPTRIVERLIDGNYRIKGSQPLMIGSREYKIIVTGIIRSEDFSEEGISSTKLLDPKFDIVSLRK